MKTGNEKSNLLSRNEASKIKSMCIRLVDLIHDMKEDLPEPTSEWKKKLEAKIAQRH